MNQIGGLPKETLRLSFEPTPSAALRATIGQEIHAFHALSVPLDIQRFAFVLRDPADQVVAALCGAISWQWLFVEALWVAETWRTRGVGRSLMAAAERHAVEAGCHSAWLDTFQARAFYEALGYQLFGTLEDYPQGQSRCFFRKRLLPDSGPAA